MTLANACLRLLFKPRVLHRLPGRLRIHLPSLKKILRGRPEIEDLITALIAVPDQIREVRIDPVTANVLILYDADGVGEDEILAYINALFEIILRSRGQLEKLSADRLTERRGRFADFVRSSLDRRLVIDPRLSVPEDLLAP